MGKLEVAEEAADAAAREAQRVVREKHKANSMTVFDERVGKAEGEAPRVLTRAACARRSPPAQSAGFDVSTAALRQVCDRSRGCRRS